MYVFITNIGMSLLSKRSFAVTSCCLIVCSLLSELMPLGLAYFGMFLAYLSPPSSLSSKTIPSWRRRFARSVLAWMAIVGGLYLMSYPLRGTGKALGYLDSWVAIEPLTYYSWGAMTGVAGLFYQPLAQNPFAGASLAILGRFAFLCGSFMNHCFRYPGGSLFCLCSIQASCKGGVHLFEA